MKNKTCGECKYFVLNGSGYCTNNDGQEDSGNDTCSFFEPKVITNGDRIRQMSNEQLAELLTNPPCFFCGMGDTDGACTVTKVSQNCKVAILEQLNAPADCVKKNGNHDTQPGLCVADNTESEEGDE